MTSLDVVNPFVLVDLSPGRRVGRFVAMVDLPVKHAVTTKQGFDVSSVRADPKTACDEIAHAVGLQGAAFCKQVHGNTVLAVNEPGLAGQADAMLTNVPGLGLAGFGADCPLILVADPAGRAVGMAHASWRATAGRIVERLIAAMCERFGVSAEKLVACIGPSAGACCYEVGDDVLDAMLEAMGEQAGRCFLRRDGKLYLDLWSANTLQLRGAGLKPENIHVAGTCTICKRELFPSYRAEGESAGRMIAVIGLS